MRGANFALIQNLKRKFLENLFWFGGFKVVLCSQSRKKTSTWNKKGLIWSCAETTNRSATALSHKQFDLKMYKQQPTDPHLHDCIDSQMLWFKNTLIHQPTNSQIRQRLGGKLPLFLQTSWESLWKIGLIFVKKIEVNDRSQLKTGLKLDRKFATSKKSVGNFSRKSPWCSEIR